MSARKKPSWKTILGSVGVCALKSGVGGALLIGLIYGVMEIGALREKARWQEKNLSAHEESHKAGMERIDEKNAAQDEKNAAQDEKNAAQDEKNAAQDEKNVAQDKKNAAQDEKLTEHGETLATIPVILERTEKSLARLENKVDALENKVDALENKVDTLLLRDSKGSASLENEGSAKNVSTSLCMRDGYNTSQVSS